MHFLLLIYFVLFADKPLSEAPALSETAILRRQKYNIPIDSTDYPVYSAYVDSLRHAGAIIHHTSRWMNGATCQMSDSLAHVARTWTFVHSVECTRDTLDATARRKHTPSVISDQPLPISSTNSTYNQLALFNVHPLHQLGYNGEGITMAICDGGFTNANTLSCFNQQHFLGAFDFTDDTQTTGQDIFGYNGDHGTECLACISAQTDYYTGAATGAQFYIMRSEEQFTESPKEADNLVVALECADSLGVDIFSVSLGYAWFDNHDWDIQVTDLNGHATRASTAADIAANKGMLVVVAAGNEGNTTWQTISSPADALSVLTVGAVDTLGHIANFSSFGMTTDGRQKPEVCAVGNQAALISPWSEQVFYGNGTSFATPLIAGMAACLWSALPDENAMQIRERIIRSANRYEQPHPQYGYGIPNAYLALTGATGIIHNSHNAVARKRLTPTGIIITRQNKQYSILGTVIQ